MTLECSPVLSSADSKRLVEKVMKTTLMDVRRAQLEGYAEKARAAYSRPIGAT